MVELPSCRCRPRLCTNDEMTRSTPTGLQNHHLLRSVVVTVAAGILFPLTFIIEFKPAIREMIGDSVAVDLLDVVFRLASGAALVMIVAPLISYRRTPGRAILFRSHLQFTLGSDPRFTATATALGAVSLFAVLAAFAAAAGVFAWDPGVLIRDRQWAVLLLALVPGVWEELAFRGVILGSLLDRYSTRVAIVLSSALFGLFHLSNFFGTSNADAVWSGVIAATILGAGWAYMVVSTQSIIPAIAMHYLVDVLLDAELFLDPTSGDSARDPVYVGLVLIWPALMVLTVRISRRWVRPPAR